MAWNTLQPSSEEDTLLPSSPCPIYPFDIAHNIDPPHFETTLPYTSHGDIPITIIGMSLTRHPSSDSPIMTPTGKSMADSGANVCVTHDLSLLTNIEDITPIPLGVAVSKPVTNAHLSAPNVGTYQSHSRMAHGTTNHSCITNMLRTQSFHPLILCAPVRDSVLGLNHATRMMIQKTTSLSWMITAIPFWSYR